MYGTVRVNEIIALLDRANNTDMRNNVMIPVVAAPASAGATGTAGEIRVVDGFIYACIATDTWQRVAIATW
jgi:hypothetical protein